MNLSSILIGLVASLLAAIIYNKLKAGSRNWLEVMVLVLVVVVSILLAGLLYPSSGGGSLVVLPDLTGLAEDEAEYELTSLDLRPFAVREYHVGTDAGIVVSNSQRPSAGQAVRPGTQVRFSVSTYRPTRSSNVDTRNSIDISIKEPASNGLAQLHPHPSGIFRIEVSGSTAGLPSDHTLLIWCRPISPPSERIGWYLQKPPATGVYDTRPSGEWDGLVQIGNDIFPPDSGDIIEIAVSALPKDEAAAVLAEPGAVVHNRPLGLAVDIATNLELAM